MASTTRAKTITVSVNARPEDVLDFMANPQNLPRWNRAFCRSVKRQDTRWLMESAEGSCPVRFLRDDRSGVLDQVMNRAGEEWVLPLRVVANGEGCEVVLILIQMPNSSENEFHAQLNRAQQGLRDLKASLEKGASRTPAADRPEEATEVPGGADAERSELDPVAADAAPSVPLAEPIPAVPGCGIKLFVGNLPFQWTENELREHFATAGPVASVEVAKFGRRGRSRGFGFVEMVNEPDTQAAIEKLHGSSAGSRAITVRLSRPKEARNAHTQNEKPAAANAVDEAGVPAPRGIEEPEDGQLQQPALNPARSRPPLRSGISKGRRETRGRFREVAAPRTARPKDPKMISRGEYEFFPRGQAVTPSPAAPTESAQPTMRHGHSVEESAYFDDTGDVENRGARARSPRRRPPAPRRRRS